MEGSERPLTIWCDETPEWYRRSKSIKPSLPLANSQSNSGSVDHDKAASTLVQRHTQARPRESQVIGDPWKTWEPVIEIIYARPVWQARRRDRKAELAHVQQLEQPLPATSSLLDSIGKVRHPSFPVLKCCYTHKDHSYLVWEPVELSISQILASKCLISENEIAAIVHPVGGKARVRGAEALMTTLDP